MNFDKKMARFYLPFTAAIFFFHINTATAISKTDYCPYSSTSQCTTWLSETDPAFGFSNIRYWPYIGFVNPWGTLNIELKSLPSEDKIHLFKDGRTQQNTFDTTFVNTYSKITQKFLYDTRRSRMEFYVDAHDHVFHVMLKSESKIVNRNNKPTWVSSENCITIDGIEDCYKVKNDGWSW